MSNKTPSLNDASPVTLADVIANIDARVDLTKRRKQDLTYSLRRLSRHLGRVPQDVRADPTELRRRLAEMSPMAAGMSRGGTRNLRSLVGQALSIVGVTSIRRRSRLPLPDAWKDALALLGDRYERARLSRFARFCGAQGIAPEMVDDAVMDRFGKALLEGDPGNRPKQVHRDACLAWNRAAATIAGWSHIKLRVPQNRRDYSYPLSAFPASFEQDVEAYLAHLRGDDLFNERARRPASPITARNQLLQIRQLASALVLSGRDPGTIRMLANLVEVEAAKTALNFAYLRNGRRKTGQIHNFALLLVNIGRHWVKIPAEHLEQLRALRQRVDPGKGGLTEKNRARLRQYTDDTNTAKLVNLPQRLLNSILQHDRGGYVEAVEVRAALAIALLLVAPMRIKNLALLNLERDFVRWHPGPRVCTHTGS